jgi:hypothetical protein
MNDLTSLKAKAYDLIAKLELLQKELKEVNAAILEKMQKEKTSTNETNSMNQP